MTFEHRHDLAFEGIQLAGPPAGAPPLVTRTVHPLLRSLEVQVQLGGDLGGAQVFLVGQLLDLAEGLVADHGVPTVAGLDRSTRRRMSAADCTSPARFSALAKGAESRARTW